MTFPVLQVLPNTNGAVDRTYHQFIVQTEGKRRNTALTFQRRRGFHLCPSFAEMPPSDRAAGVAGGEDVPCLVESDRPDGARRSCERWPNRRLVRPCWIP